MAYPLAEAFGLTTVYRLGAATLFAGGAAVLLTLRHARARPS
jgi:hypothetical protein